MNTHTNANASIETSTYAVMEASATQAHQRVGEFGSLITAALEVAHIESSLGVETRWVIGPGGRVLLDAEAGDARTDALEVRGDGVVWFFLDDGRRRGYRVAQEGAETFRRPLRLGRKMPRQWENCVAQKERYRRITIRRVAIRRMGVTFLI